MLRCSSVSGVRAQAMRQALRRSAARPLDSIRIKSALRLSAKPAGSYVRPEQRTGAILRITDAVVQHFENGKARVEANEIRQCKRSEWVIHSQLHDGVDRFSRSDAFHE